MPPQEKGQTPLCWTRLFGVGIYGEEVQTLQSVSAKPRATGPVP